MNTKQTKKTSWISHASLIPRTFSLLIIAVWLLSITVIYGFGPYFMLGLMFWIVLVLTTIVAWKNDPFGGALFIIIGSLYLVFVMGNTLSLAYIFGAVPFFITGSLFILTYFYEEKKELAREVDF